MLDIIRKTLYWFVVTIHVIITLILFFYVYFTNNIYHLSAIIIACVGLYLQWLVWGHCLLVDIEDFLLNTKRTTPLVHGKRYSVLWLPLMHIFGTQKIYYGATLYPFIVILVALYKILNRCSPHSTHQKLDTHDTSENKNANTNNHPLQPSKI